MLNCMCGGMVQDLGPLAATAAFAEVIKSEQRNPYAERQRQLQQNGRLQSLEGHFLETEDDWQVSLQPL